MKLAPATLPSNARFASGSRLAACAAAWCGVHCALTPVIVAVMPALALSESLERYVFVGSVLLGITMLILGPARRHGLVLLTFASGAALWAASLAGRLEPLPENVTSGIGSLVLAPALFWSVRVCQTGECVVCGNSEDGNRAD